MWLDFVTPRFGERVSSPIRFRGRTNKVLSDPRITVRLYDQNWNLLAETATTLKGEIGAAGTFSGEITVSDYTGAAILFADTNSSDASISTRINIKRP